MAIWRKISGAAAMALAISALAACGDETGSDGDAAGAGADVAASVDTGLGGGDTEPADTGTGTDATADTTPLEVNTTDADAAKTCPGVPGCTCAENKDCDNAMCIETPNGKQCAAPCADKCADGFKCAQVTNAGGDVQSICVPAHGKLCNPCTTSAACAALGQATPLCADHGNAGKFCGAECKADTDCPKDFACADVKSAEGTPAKTCVPKADTAGVIGLCGCSPAAIAAGLSTTCSAPAKDDKGNVVGGCPGQRKCTKDGLAACDAPAAAPETCDGLDNDCNGKTDEGTCDDGNACTGDACGKAADGKIECQSTQLDTPCDDKNACSEGDICKGGTCTAGAPKACADSNVCTLDTCDPATGCAQANDDGAPCDDDNPCTQGDACQAGACVSGLTKDCTSTDDCQTAKCDQVGGKCVFTDKQDGIPCNDGTVCTAADACKTGACNGELVPCDDGNPCTIDACDNAAGCTATNADLACTDNNACTGNDLCSGGACKPGAAKDCNDNDGCTLDTCDVQSGDCKNEAIVGCGGNCADPKDCNDGNPCTNDECKDGKCAVTANTASCDDADQCTDKDVCANGVCVGSAKVCDDKNPCTSDSCDKASGCANDANSNNCDDGNACTIGDGCADKACKPGAATVCDDKNPCTDQVCDTKTGKCTATANTAACSDSNACTSGDACAASACKPGTAKVCDDKNPCTNDSCNPATGACVVTNNTAACTDNNACTAGDVCTNGACKPGTAKVCDDKNPCTLDACDKATGNCSATPIVGCGGNCKVTTDCDDKNPCTTDACTNGKCANSANTLACDDKNGCTVGDVCTSGVCKPGASKVCDDKNPCTDDSCDTATGACKATNNTVPCNDNNACTLNDACAAGACVPGAAMVCDDKNPCTVGETCKLGACVAGVAKVCDDKNGCTTDSCDKLSGNCVFANNTAACTDSNACTTGDVCAAGACKPGVAANCNDNNVCTTDSCDKASGKCGNTANSLACSDNNACTVGDACVVGLCKAGTPTVCDDKNPCTVDSCETANGKCKYLFLTAGTACSDGLLCTTGDKCDALGKCAGTNVVCKSTVCQANACDANTGLCKAANKPTSTPCDDLQACTKPDMCDGNGKCKSGPWDLSCGCQTNANCDDKNPCTVDTCVATKCQFAISDKAACDDGDVCTTTSACDATGKCVGTASFSCSGANDQCNTGTCIDSGSGPACKKVPKTVGTACSDGKFCTTGEACDKLGACVGGLPVSCGKPAQCFQSLCTEAAKGCTTPFQPKGTSCTDNSICTDKDVCDGAGKCAGTVLASCTPVLTGFKPASPSTATATAANGTATATTNVWLYSGNVCGGKSLNASAATAAPAFSVPFTAVKQACTTVSAQAVDAAGTKSGCSNAITYNNYSCTQCPCGDSDWIRRYGGAKSDMGTAVVADAAGNAFATAITDGALTPGTALGGNDAVLTRHDTTGARVWTTQFGSTLDDNAVAVALDNAGAVWVMGTTSGDMDGAAGPLLAPGAGDTSVYFARFDPLTGKQNLVKVWGTALHKEAAVDMQWDAQNTRLVALIQTANPDGGDLSPQVVTINASTGAVATLWWFKGDNWNKNPTGMHLDFAANVYVAGRTQNGIAGALSTTGVAGGGIYLYKISPAGKTTWLQQWGSPAFDYGGGVVTDGAGKVYATGFVQGLATGAQSGAKYAGSNGSGWGFGGDLVVAQFDEVSGKQNWLYQTGTAGGDAGLHLEYQSGKTGGVMVFGYTGGNMETLAATSKYGMRDIVYLKLTAFGTLQTTRQAGTAADDVVGKVFRAANGSNLWLPGWSDADWIGQSPDACAAQTSREAFLARWCVQGTVLPPVK